MAIQAKAVEYGQDDLTFEGYFAGNDENEQPSPIILVAHAWAGQGEYEHCLLYTSPSPRDRG